MRFSFDLFPQVELNYWVLVKFNLSIRLALGEMDWLTFLERVSKKTFGGDGSFLSRKRRGLMGSGLF
jgi:hypothetical protein